MTDNEDSIKELEEFVERETQDLIEVLTEVPSHILRVLQFHLLSEYLLERIILAKLSRGDRLIDQAGLTYHQKLCLVDSFDLVSDAVIQALKHLNKLRNECAHEKDKAIKICDIELVGRSLGKQFATIRRDCAGDLEEMIARTFLAIHSILLAEVYRLEHQITK